MSTLYLNALASDPAAEFPSLINSAQLSLDPDTSIRAGGSFRVAGSGSSAYGRITGLANHVLTSRSYFMLDALPAGINTTASLVQSEGTSSAFVFQINSSGHPVPKIGTGRTDTAFTFAPLTWYRLDMRWDASGATWTLDYEISGLTEALLYTGIQLTLGSQVADTISAYRIGQNGATALNVACVDLKVTDQAADYPLGAWFYESPPTAVPIPSSWKPRVGRGAVLGIAPHGTADLGASVVAALATREAQMARRFVIAHTFLVWNDATKVLTREQDVVFTGHIPMISWPTAGSTPTTGGSTGTGAVQGVAAGDYDAQITTLITNMQALASPVVYFRFAWEFNGNRNAWRDSPSDYKAAWSHIRALVRGLGASRIQMVWCPQRRATNTNSYLWGDYQPPDADVDVYGLDAYAASEVELLGQLITTGDYPKGSGLDHDWYATYKGYGKPLMICESGCREQNDPTMPVGVSQPFTKAAWFADWQTAIQNYPMIFAYAVFDETTSTADYRLDTTTTPLTYDSTAATFQAFKTLGADAYWNLSYSVYVHGPSLLVAAA